MTDQPRRSEDAMMQEHQPPAVVNIVDVYPDAVQLPADRITKGAYLFDAFGDRHEVTAVRILKRGSVKVTRAGGEVDEFSARELVTFVPCPGSADGA
ncbi:hypothetical protein F5X71_34445 [Nocardia brasiliensis]|uniref:Uncharacterized protein n=1 Tax=Nocardia brasiliensis TaxID=37326 RepID=A0A6G9Y0J6_NOCBR|nr:hypothetical protein [Nocardia brasiliensis]QIS06728.1 hypothetical protein F5X71_34445 [Nocardia brasiliensis]